MYNKLPCFGCYDFSCAQHGCKRVREQAERQKLEQWYLNANKVMSRVDISDASVERIAAAIAAKLQPKKRKGARKS